ncbi:MAG: C25 family cysteine peptidase [Candidatus Aminicenantales bacterium]
MHEKKIRSSTEKIRKRKEMGKMSRKIFAFFTLLTLLLISGAGSVSSEKKGELSFLISDSYGLIFEIKFPSFGVSQRFFSTGIFEELETRGLGTTSEVGKPMLPFKGFLVEIPSTGKVEVRVLETETDTYSNVHLPLSPEYQIVEDEAGIQRVEKSIPLNSFSPSSGFYPEKVAELGFTGFIRNRRVAQLKVYPFQYDQGSCILKHHKKVLVQMIFENPAIRDRSTPPDPYFDHMFKDIILNFDEKPFLKSGETSFFHLASSEPNSRPSDYRIPVRENGIYRITYSDLVNAGISPSTIDAKTLKIFCQGEEVAIYVSSQDSDFGESDYVLFYGEGLDTEYTDTNIYWLSWGGVLGKRMAEVDGTPGSEPLLETHFRTDHFEENTNYWIPMPYGEGKDHWFWERINAGEKKSYDFNLNRPASAPYTGKIRVSVYGRTSIGLNPDHHLRIYLNGDYLGEGYFDGQVGYECSVEVDQALFIPGTNTLEVELVNDTGSPNSIFLNYFEVDYYDEFYASDNSFSFRAQRQGINRVKISNFTENTVQIFDITDHNNVKRVVNVPVMAESNSMEHGRFQNAFSSSILKRSIQLDFKRGSAASFNAVFSCSFLGSEKFIALTESTMKNARVELAQTGGIPQRRHVDYIIVTHPDFLNEANFLANYRMKVGFDVEVVTTQDIYDAFNFGIEDPQAIKDFLNYAYQNWQMPSFVLFLGDATADPRDYMGTGRINYVPAYLDNVGGDLGYQVPCDNWYFCISGEGDLLPDFFGGRLTVKSRQEARAVLHKIRVHETYLKGMRSGNWRGVENRIDRIRDRERFFRTPPAQTRRAVFVADDNSTSFSELNDELSRDYFPSNFEKIKIYLQNYSGVGEAKGDLISSINLGVLTVTYVGHGAYDNWSGENLFTASDVDSLNNIKFPFVLSLSCLNGYFAGWPRELWGRLIDDCLAEKFMNAPNKGAIAVYAPSGLGYTWEHSLLAKSLYQIIFTPGEVSLGEAVTRAKITAYYSGATPDLVQTYMLFGDPASILALIEEE